MLVIDKMDLHFVMTDDLFVDHSLFFKNKIYIRLKYSPKNKITWKLKKTIRACERKTFNKQQ